MSFAMVLGAASAIGQAVYGVGSAIGGMVGGAFGAGGAPAAVSAPSSIAAMAPEMASLGIVPGLGAEGATLGAGLGAAGITGSTAGAAFGTAGTGAAIGGLFSGLMDPLMLGSAGLNMASAFSNGGTTLQTAVKMSHKGKVLKRNYYRETAKMFANASSGKVPEKSYQDLSNLRTQENRRKQMTDAQFSDTEATIANRETINRGGAAVGGGLIRTAGVNAEQRMQGLFAPSSILNNYRKEELMNAVGHMQNMYNLENQTASINYQGQLAKWNANNIASANKGAAIGGALSMFGGMAMNNAYMNRMNMAGQIA